MFVRNKAHNKVYGVSTMQTAQQAQVSKQTLTLTQLHTIVKNAFNMCDTIEYDGTAGRQFVQQANIFASLQALYFKMQYEWEQHCTYDKATNTCSDSATAIPLDLVCYTIVQHLVYWDDEWEYYFANALVAPDVAQYANLHS